MAESLCQLLVQAREPSGSIEMWRANTAGSRRDALANIAANARQLGWTDINVWTHHDDLDSAERVNAMLVATGREPRWDTEAMRAVHKDGRVVAPVMTDHGDVAPDMARILTPADMQAPALVTPPVKIIDHGNT